MSTYNDKDDGAWFAAKSHGLGSGLPIAWQGWVLMLVHIAVLVGLSFAFATRPTVLMAVVLPLALLPLPLYAAKTRGGWKWRWGGDK